MRKIGSFLKTISNEKESNTYRFINILNISYNCYDFLSIYTKKWSPIFWGKKTKNKKQLHTIRRNRSCMFLRGSYQGVEWVFIAWGWRSLTSRSGPLTGTCWNKTPKHPHTLVNSVILIMFWRKGQRYTIAKCVQIYVKIFVESSAWYWLLISPTH